MKIGGGVNMGLQMNVNFNWAQFLNQINRQNVYVILGSVLIFRLTYKAFNDTP